MVKLYIYDEDISEKELENEFEEIVYSFLYNKQITDGNYAISFPHEQISKNQLIKIITSPYFDTYFSLTPDDKLEYFYIVLNDSQTTKLMKKYYL
jgi:hypothetical protein